MDYKAEVTLNEKDSLQDALALEKTLVKIYAYALTEGCSKGFRKIAEEFLIETANDQFKVFLLMTEHDYYRVQSADKETLSEKKQIFSKVKGQLS